MGESQAPANVCPVCGETEMGFIPPFSRPLTRTENDGAPSSFLGCPTPFRRVLAKGWERHFVSSLTKKSAIV